MSEIVWYGAFNYYCGRQTIAVSAFVDELIDAWPQLLTDRAKFLIKRDLDAAFIEDDESRKNGSHKRLGWDCDRAKWEEVRALWKDDIA